MTYQEVKKLLEDLKRSKRLCLRYKDEIAAIKDDYGALSSPVGSFGQPRCHSTTPTTMRLIERLEARQERFEKELAKMMDIEDRLAEAIQLLDKAEQDIIIGYYMRERKHHQLAMELYCSPETTYRIKRRAIKKLSKFIS